MEVIPHITPTGLKETLKYLEHEGTPSNVTTALARLDTMIAEHMKYDAVNYLLGDLIDSRPESFIASVDPNKIGISESQLRVLRQRIPKIKKFIRELQAKYLESSEIPDLEAGTKDLEGLRKLLG